jgi:hypothetical protein
MDTFSILPILGTIFNFNFSSSIIKLTKVILIFIIWESLEKLFCGDWKYLLELLTKHNETSSNFKENLSKARKISRNSQIPKINQEEND